MLANSLVLVKRSVTIFKSNKVQCRILKGERERLVLIHLWLQCFCAPLEMSLWLRQLQKTE